MTRARLFSTAHRAAPAAVPAAPHLPPVPRLPRCLRLRRPVSAGVIAALCAALSAPVTTPAMLATGAAALLAAGTHGPVWSSTEAVNPIPGIGVVVKKNPGSGAHRATTDSNGRYEYTGLAPGLYDLLIDGQPPRQVKVGADGRLSGVVTRPVKASGLQSAELAPNAARVQGGPGELQPPRPAASDIRSVPTTNPTPVPK